MSRRWMSILFLAALAAALVLLRSGDLGTDPAPSPTTTTSSAVGTASTDLAGLPREAVETIALIDAGGPFPYDRDGVVFENRERLLPQHPRGWYREYTVPTPGEDDRGARRLVEGQSGALWYSDDHYGSFRQIRGER